MRNDAAEYDFDLGVEIVIAFVEAQVLRTTRSARSANDDAVENLADEPFVVHVRAGDAHRQRYAAAIGQDVPFDALFRPIGRVGARVVPPFGAFTEALSRDVHFHWMPRLPS